MLAIHWSAVNNTKKILKNGIVKSKNGVYCFPLTGHRDVDKWWVGKNEIIKDKKLYNQTLNDHDFIRFIFEDCQIVLEGSISPKCIIKVVSDRDEYGRVLRAKKMQKEAYVDIDF